MKKRRLNKGSFTVEAACVMSLVLLAIMGLIYLTFFVHNRSWLTAAACESALAGSMEEIREDGRGYEAASLRSRELGNTGFFGTSELRYHVEDGKNIRVTYTADTVSAFGKFQWKLNAEGHAKVICPARWIRKVRAVKKIAGSDGG